MATVPGNSRLEILIEQMENRSRAPDVCTIEFDQLQDSIAACRAVIAAREVCKEWDQESRTRSAHTPELLQLSARTLAHCARSLTAAVGEHEGVGR